MRMQAFFLAILAFTSVFACSAKSDSESGSKSSTQPKVSVVASKAPKAKAPTVTVVLEGNIKGRINLLGSPPPMPFLKRGADPVCASKRMRAETIVVGAKQGLANVVVRIKPGTVPSTPLPKTPVIVDQSDCMYRPRVQNGLRGQQVEVRNSDATTHNVHARHLPFGRRQGIETIVNRAQPAGVSMQFELGEEPVAKLKCDYHGWMQGYIVVSDNTYFTVTQPDGSFHLKGLPLGKHTLELWHEYYGLKEMKVDIQKQTEFNATFDAQKDDPMGDAQ